ncbi:MAG: glucosyltransferase domain-containing protein [Eubacteriales bacterium]|nr:glucosyltransferase domain-containing protein [Eubacteriales bacterium]
MNQLKSFFFMERCFNFLLSKAKTYQIPLLSSIAFSFLAYGFSLTNKLVNHDDVFYLFSKGGTTILGRWGLEICERFFPNFSMPWIYGIFSILLIALSVCVIVKIFSIRSNLLQILLAGIIATFPSFTAMMSYMFTASSFCLAILMTVTAGALLKKPTFLSVVFSLGCMIFSLSIYQAYISLASGLLILILIQEIIEGADAIYVFRKGLGYIIFLIVSVIGYYLATLVVQKILGLSFGSYANQYMTFSISELPDKITLSYTSFFNFLFGWPNWLIPAILARRLNYLFLGIIFVFFLIWSKFAKTKTLASILLFAALLSILPLAINCMYLVTPPAAIHSFVMYGFVCFYLLIILLADRCLDLPIKEKLLHRVHLCAVDIVSLSLALFVASNVYLANAAALNLHLQYENTYAFFTSVTADMKMMPEFNESTRLALIGDYQCPIYHDRYLFESRSLTGVEGMYPDSYSNAQFVEYYLGFPIPFASGEEVDAIKNTYEYANMPCYPYDGSLKFFGDILVVKLS